MVTVATTDSTLFSLHCCIYSRYMLNAKCALRVRYTHSTRCNTYGRMVFARIYWATIRSSDNFYGFSQWWYIAFAAFAFNVRGVYVIAANNLEWVRWLRAIWLEQLLLMLFKVLEHRSRHIHIKFVVWHRRDTNRQALNQQMILYIRTT